MITEGVCEVFQTDSRTIDFYSAVLNPDQTSRILRAIREPESEVRVITKKVLRENFYFAVKRRVRVWTLVSGAGPQDLPL